MTANWRRNAIKFVDRMNTLKTYEPTHTLFKEYDEIAREGVIHTYLKEDVTKGFFYGVKYIKADKILHFFNLDRPEERIQPWRLIQELVENKESPEVKPFTPPVIEREKKARLIPCPEIYLTRFEFDVFVNGIYLSPENKIKEPWTQRKTCRVRSNTISQHITLGDLKPQQVPSVMSSLVKKGLITCTTAKRDNQRYCKVTPVGKLVLRREFTGA